MVEVKSQKPTFQSFCNPLFWPPCILGVPPTKLWTPLQEFLNPLESCSVAWSQWSGNLGHLTHSSSKPLFHVLKTLSASWSQMNASKGIPSGPGLNGLLLLDLSQFIGIPHRKSLEHPEASLEKIWTRMYFLVPFALQAFSSFTLVYRFGYIRRVGLCATRGLMEVGCPQAKIWEMLSTRFDLTELLIFPWVLPHQTIRWR